MNAALKQAPIVPMNLSALRLSATPSDFSGRTTQYEKLPYRHSTPAANTSVAMAIDLANDSVAALLPGCICTGSCRTRSRGGSSRRTRHCAFR